MEREKIHLTNQQWRDVVYEGYLEIDGNEIKIKEVENNYDGSSRHTEEHHIIFKRENDNKFFKLDYETSVKDEMGWGECNYGETDAVEVFPEVVTTTKYR